MRYPDFRPAPNIGAHPDVYELENEAIARDGRLDTALERAAPTHGRRVLDIGCGTGFWLPRLAETAIQVTGVEPDPLLRDLAEERVGAHTAIDVVAGSAEHLPFPDGSFDVVHARFAYFFGPGSERGLAEVRRVLAPRGRFVAVDNDDRPSEFTCLLAASTGGNSDHDLRATARWWAAQGADRIRLDVGWRARSVDELFAILAIEFPPTVVDTFRRRHDKPTITVSNALFVITARQAITAR